MMEDTPSNYNIPNQRFEPNYYDVEEIVEDGKENKYDDAGKLVQKRRLKRKPKKKKNKDLPPRDTSNMNVDRDALMGMAYGETSS
jgi:hypothetical protein